MQIVILIAVVCVFFSVLESQLVRMKAIIYTFQPRCKPVKVEYVFELFVYFLFMFIA